MASAPTPTPIAPTATAEQGATEAPPPIDVAPTDAPLPAATDKPPPSPTPLLIAVLPVDAGGGDVPNIRNSNPVKGGRNVTLPGFVPDKAVEPMVYRDRIVCQAEVFDANVGANDGDGIENMIFTIVDSEGDLVHERTENHAGYCVFGGCEQDCNVLSLAEENPRWLGGASISSGLHDVSIEINPYAGHNVVWMWSFEIDLPQAASAGSTVRTLQGASASITGISLKGDSDSVDFETPGFEPQLPGQHVHVFFDTVPPEEAGLPGQARGSSMEPRVPSQSTGSPTGLQKPQRCASSLPSPITRF
mgnify:FL=1